MTTSDRSIITTIVDDMQARVDESLPLRRRIRLAAWYRLLGVSTPDYRYYRGHVASMPIRVIPGTDPPSYAGVLFKPRARYIRVGAEYVRWLITESGSDLR
jgi:hypothetical protein